MSAASEILHEQLQVKKEEVINLTVLSVDSISSTQILSAEVIAEDALALETVESFQKEGAELVNAVILDFERQSSEVQAIICLSIKAAANGHAHGQYTLGESYESIKLYKHAFFWYGLAAAQGHSDAQYKLGCLYQEYTGVLNDISNNPVNFPDVQKALEWHSQAADQGHVGAQYKVGCFYRHCIDLNNKSFNLVKTRGMGYHWIRRAAEQGHSEAQYVLGYSYQYEPPVRWMDADNEISFPDMQKAFEWYSKAAVQNHSDALFALGYLYQHHNTYDAIITDTEGKNIIFPELSKSREFYEQALAAGHEDARAALESLQPEQKKESELQNLRAIIVSRDEEVAFCRAIIEAQDKKIAVLKKNVSESSLYALKCDREIKQFQAQLAAQNAQVTKLLLLKEEITSSRNDNDSVLLHSSEARGLPSPSKKNKSAGGVEQECSRNRASLGAR